MRERQHEWKFATERMKNFIAANLRHPITARDVAEAAGYSQYHAARVFKAETGLSPFEYVRRERLTAGALELRLRDQTVLDVALDFVFDSHEGFTRAFSNGFGIPPKRFASRPLPDGWLIPYRYLDRARIKRKDLNMTETAVIFTQIVERPARKLILKWSKSASGYFEYVEEFGCGEENNSAPWDALVKIKEALYEPVGLWLPENMRPPGTGVYAHGVEVSMEFDLAKVPDGFDVIDLESCRLLVMQGEPFDGNEYLQAVEEGMDRFDSFNPEVYGYEYAPELGPRIQLAPEGWRGHIEMRPVRQVS